MLNVTFVGNLGADAEMNDVEGTPVVNFRVAVKTAFDKDADPEWVQCAMWGSRAEKVVKFLEKGKQVLVSGTLSTREYEHKGEARYSLDVRVNELELLGGGSKSDEKDTDRKNGRKNDDRREARR